MRLNTKLSNEDDLNYIMGLATFKIGIQGTMEREDKLKETEQKGKKIVFWLLIFLRKNKVPTLHNKLNHQRAISNLLVII